jgi:hypothetical protein
VSIIPASRTWRRAHGDQQRIVRVAEVAAHRLLEVTRCSPASWSISGGAPSFVRKIRHASVVIVKPGGTGSPMFVISARLAPLPPRQVLHVLVAFGEVVDVLGHRMPPELVANGTVSLRRLEAGGENRKDPA